MEAVFGGQVGSAARSTEQLRVNFLNLIFVSIFHLVERVPREPVLFLHRRLGTLNPYTFAL